MSQIGKFTIHANPKGGGYSPRLCIRCCVGEVIQRSSEASNVCLWCRMGDKVDRTVEEVG